MFIPHPCFGDTVCPLPSSWEVCSFYFIEQADHALSHLCWLCLSSSKTPNLDFPFLCKALFLRETENTTLNYIVLNRVRKLYLYEKIVFEAVRVQICEGQHHWKLE